MKTALLVIDVQKSFHQHPAWSELGFQDYCQNQTLLIAKARDLSWPVVHIYHLEDEGVFSEADGLVKAMPFVDVQPGDPVFKKRVHNALTESGLHEWLQAEAIERLVISGIRTEQCCETTARVASDFGFAVEFVSEATMSFPMRHQISGNQYDLAALRERTELVLADRFAKITRVCDYEETLPA